MAIRPVKETTAPVQNIIAWIGYGVQKITKYDKNNLRLSFFSCILFPKICPHKTPFQYTVPLQPFRSDGPVLEWTDRHQCSSAPRTFLKEYCAMRVWLITQMVFRRWIISARHSDNLSVRFMFMQEKQEGNDLAAQWLNGRLVYGKKS